MIPLLKPSCSEAEINAVTAVLRSGWWGQGAVCEQFEQECAALHGLSHCATTNSATEALHLALLAAGIGEGDEVILPALTFISTALAISYVGAMAVFADVQADTLCIDWHDVERRITDKTRAIIPVDYAGYPAIPPQRYYYTIVQDAAHHAGGIAYGDLVCLSFHPVKNIASGDGGAVLTNNADWDGRIRSLRWCGIDRSTYERVRARYGWDYDISEIGYKAHWNDIQAAIGLAQLRRARQLLGRRREIANLYRAYLADVDGLQLPLDHTAHTWHLYPVRVDAERRDEVVDRMLAAGISVGVHYKPLTHYPMYAGADLPVTEREWQRLISLPIFYDLTDDEARRVAYTLTDILEN